MCYLLLADSEHCERKVFILLFVRFCSSSFYPCVLIAGFEMCSYNCFEVLQSLNTYVS